MRTRGAMVLPVDSLLRMRAIAVWLPSPLWGGVGGGGRGVGHVRATPPDPPPRPSPTRGEGEEESRGLGQRILCFGERPVEPLSQYLDIRRLDARAALN